MGVNFFFCWESAKPVPVASSLKCLVLFTFFFSAVRWVVAAVERLASFLLAGNRFFSISSLFSLHSSNSLTIAGREAFYRYCIIRWTVSNTPSLCVCLFIRFFITTQAFSLFLWITWRAYFCPWLWIVLNNVWLSLRIRISSRKRTHLLARRVCSGTRVNTAMQRTKWLWKMYLRRFRTNGNIYYRPPICTSLKHIPSKYPHNLLTTSCILLFVIRIRIDLSSETKFSNGFLNDTKSSLSSAWSSTMSYSITRSKSCYEE